MVIGQFRQQGVQRNAAWLALFAILLIIISPPISVALQKDPMRAVPGMHHEMDMTADHAPHHDVSSFTPLTVDHGEACGYCVLLAHVPGLLLARVILPGGLLLRQMNRPSRPSVNHWHFFPWLYPDTRAPPYCSTAS